MNRRIIPTGPNPQPISAEVRAFYLGSADLLNAIDGGMERMLALASLAATFCMTSARPDAAYEHFQVMVAECLAAAIQTTTPASDVRN